MNIYFFFFFSVVLACCGKGEDGATPQDPTPNQQNPTQPKPTTPSQQNPLQPKAAQGSFPQPKASQKTEDLIIRKPANWKTPAQFSLAKSIKEFSLTATSNPKIFLCQNSILNLKNVAIVNAANRPCLGGGGIDGQIHKAAGPGLVQEIESNYTAFTHIIPGQIMTIRDRIVTGGALITGPHKSQCACIIHTAGPNCNNGDERSKKESLLTAAYTNSLRLAEQCGLKVVAFPMISGELFKYPPEEQCRVACESVHNFFAENPNTTVEGVIFVFYTDDLGKEAYKRYQDRLVK